MPITTPAGVHVRTATFWFPANHWGIDDWTIPLSTMLGGELEPDPRLLALPPHSGRARALLAAPVDGSPIRCAGGLLGLLDLAGTGAEAAQRARARRDTWSQTGRIRGRRPGRVEEALLRAGRQTYVTYHSLRRVVGDALIIMGTRTPLCPTERTTQALVDYVHQATMRLADAAPDDVLVTAAV
ncbi:hypothetical protein WEI85_00685 [Actinomycetes bacterium KLBMP 9797]